MSLSNSFPVPKVISRGKRLLVVAEVQLEAALKKCLYAREDGRNTRHQLLWQPDFNDAKEPGRARWVIGFFDDDPFPVSVDLRYDCGTGHRLE